MNNTNENQNIQKSPDRLKVLARIEEYEKKGWFSKDVEDDPPTIPLTSDNVDYLRKKLKNKILARIITFYAQRFIDKLIRTKQLIIKEVKGMENFEQVKKSGLIITCNHFNAFDNFALHKIFRHKIRILYKVIREGNFTSFGGLYGLFFRHCDTIPLSSVYSTQKLFFNAVDTLLTRGEKILVYAEQGMWWNYRKPRPLTKGAFLFAVKSKVPILPIFITMNDSNIIGQDGFPIQEYTINILPAIYPDKNKSDKQNIEELMNKNYSMWKDVYEKTYGIPLTYSTEEQK